MVFKFAHSRCCSASYLITLGAQMINAISHARCRVAEPETLSSHKCAHIEVMAADKRR